MIARKALSTINKGLIIKEITQQEELFYRFWMT
jgi:hypothetical protein